jgi:hypothetical protein
MLKFNNSGIAFWTACLFARSLFSAAAIANTLLG